MYIYIYIYIYTHTHTHTYNGTSLRHKKNKIMAFAATWTDPEIVRLNEVSQTEKNAYPMVSLICGI